MSFIISAIASLLMFIDMIFSSNPVTVRATLTYVPLAALSQYIQQELGVGAIRFIDSHWDERRGPLYPALWYKWFSLYQPDSEDKKEKVKQVMSQAGAVLSIFAF